MNMARKIALNRQFDTSSTFLVVVKGALKRKGDNEVGDKKPVNRTKPDRKKSCKSGGINTSNHKWHDRTDQGSLQNAQKSAGRMRERGKNSPQWPTFTSRSQHRHEANQVLSVVGRCIIFMTCKRHWNRGIKYGI
jgi:hypothetical protein